jgi:hypothetical protein
VSGGAFVIGTLLLARALDAATFGQLAIAVALTNLGMFGGTAGLTGVWMRHDLRADAAMLRGAAYTLVPAALLLVAAGWLLYTLDLVLLAFVAAAIVCGGLGLLGLVPLQKARRFDLAVPLSQSGNAVLLLSGVVLLAVPTLRLSWLPLAGIALVSIAIACFAWTGEYRKVASGEQFRPALWSDAFRFMSVAMAAELLVQLERLLIPLTLEIDVLRSFVVLAAVAIAPYSTLEKAVNATLVPRLQKASDLPARREVLRAELISMTVMCVGGGVLIVWLGPYVIDAFELLAPEISRGVLVAAALSGTARTLAALPRAVAGAFASACELRALNRYAWLATAWAAAAGLALSHFGLVGVLAGVASGWVLRGFGAFVVSRGHLAPGIAMEGAKV